MSNEAPTPPSLTRLATPLVIAALALFGILIIALSHLFGKNSILQEVISSFGNAILLLAIFELFFKSALEGYLRKVTHWDATEKAGRALQEAEDTLRELNEYINRFLYEEKLTDIEEATSAIPEIQKEVEELRKLLLDAEYRKKETEQYQADRELDRLADELDQERQQETKED
jgi:hypothetical protein